MYSIAEVYSRKQHNIRSLGLLLTKAERYLTQGGSIIQYIREQEKLFYFDLQNFLLFLGLIACATFSVSFLNLLL